MIVSNIFILIIFNIYAIKTDDCKYLKPSGTTDLRILGYKNRPKYIDIHDTSLKEPLTYSFNSCFSYSTTDTCQNTTACVSKIFLFYFTKNISFIILF